ncbi:uncharacterized protein EV420DRAFT_1488284 [Desarmillaria tabescens]|uniref:Uncharacterized protein n=1 Tax=Armillaria tabescens TaxID=1929756 RepID=A0AA39J2N3_ARMTA|nr:uncharacterized protein EV420DRAFT_1488284 [Desarmillaria tabescens]KAK0435006.1 hypothetical protein EV420DRAFT_1488284 [Desarmillaria tabescens]
MPAFAMMAHKVQGQTLRNVIIDLESCRGTEAPPFKIDKIQKRQSEDYRNESRRLRVLQLLTNQKYGNKREIEGANKELAQIAVVCNPNSLHVNEDTDANSLGDRQLLQFEEAVDRLGLVKTKRKNESDNEHQRRPKRHRADTRKLVNERLGNARALGLQLRAFVDRRPLLAATLCRLHRHVWDRVISNMHSTLFAGPFVRWHAYFQHTLTYAPNDWSPSINNRMIVLVKSNFRLRFSIVFGGVASVILLPVWVEDRWQPNVDSPNFPPCQKDNNVIDLRSPSLEEQERRQLRPVFPQEVIDEIICLACFSDSILPGPKNTPQEVWELFEHVPHIIHFVRRMDIELDPIP